MFSPRALCARPLDYLRCHDMTVTFCRFCLRRHMSLVGSRVSRLGLAIEYSENCAHRHSLIAMFSLLDTYTLYHCEWRGNLARSGGYRAEGWLQVDRGAAHRAQGRAPVRWRRGHVPGAASSTGVAGRNRSHGRGRRQRGAAGRAPEQCSGGGGKKGVMWCE